MDTTIDADGWTRNTGIEPTVPDGHRLDVKYRRGNTVRGADQITGEFRWSLIGADGDIVAFCFAPLTAPDSMADDQNSRTYCGVVLDAAPSLSCNGCYFQNKSECRFPNDGLGPQNAYCSPTERGDRKCVIWVERQPTGESDPAGRDPHTPGAKLDAGKIRPALAQGGFARAPGAPTLLDAAAGHMRDRAATYDQPTGERSMGRAVQALNAILGRQALTESEGWLLLQVLKDVRDRQRIVPHRDSLEDAIAYAALKAEARLAEGGAA